MMSEASDTGVPLWHQYPHAKSISVTSKCIYNTVCLVSLAAGKTYIQIEQMYLLHDDTLVTTNLRFSLHS